MYRGTTMAGIIQDEVAATTRSAASSAATSWRPCRSACRSWRRSSIPAPGAATSPARWRTIPTWPACGSSARTCRRRTTGSRCTRPRRTSSACRSRTSTSTTTRTTSPCAATPSGRARRSTRRPARRDVYETPPYPSTHNLGTNRMSEKPRDGVVNKHGQTHDIKNLFVSDGSQFTTGARREPDADHRHAGHPPGRLHRRPDGQEGDLIRSSQGRLRWPPLRGFA